MPNILNPSCPQLVLFTWVVKLYPIYLELLWLKYCAGSSNILIFNPLLSLAGLSTTRIPREDETSMKIYNLWTTRDGWQWHFPLLLTSRYFSWKVASSNSETKWFAFDFHDVGARIIISQVFTVFNLLGYIFVNMIFPKYNLCGKRKHFSQLNPENNFCLV